MTNLLHVKIIFNHGKDLNYTLHRMIYSLKNRQKHPECNTEHETLFSKAVSDLMMRETEANISLLINIHVLK